MSIRPSSNGRRAEYYLFRLHPYTPYLLFLLTWRRAKAKGKKLSARDEAKSSGLFSSCRTKLPVDIEANIREIPWQLFRPGSHDRDSAQVTEVAIGATRCLALKHRLSLFFEQRERSCHPTENGLVNCPCSGPVILVMRFGA